MNTSLTLKSTMLILAGSLALAAPAFARQSADDPAGHVSGGHGADDPAGHVSGGNGADDPANHDVGDDHGGGNGGNGNGGNGGNGSGKSRLRLAIADSDSADTTAFRGKFRQEIKKNRTELRVDVKLKDAVDLADADAAEAATVTATFDDGAGATVSCDLDFDEFERKKAEYHLRLKLRGDSLSEKAGDCGGVLPPVVSGGTLTVAVEIPTADPNAPTVRNVGSLTFP